MLAAVAGVVWLNSLPAMAQSPLLHLRFDKLDHALLDAEQVEIYLVQGEGDSSPITVSAERLQLAQQVFTNIRIQCDVNLGKTLLVCEAGKARLRHDRLGRLSGQLGFRYDLTSGLQSVTLTRMQIMDGRVDMVLHGPAPAWQLDMEIAGLDLELAQPLLGMAGFTGPVETLEGRISGSVNAAGWPADTVRADVVLTDVNYSGESVVQAASGKVSIDVIKEANDWQGELKLSADSGELYIVPPLPEHENPPGFYIAINSEPLILDAVFNYAINSSTLIIQDLEYIHPAVMQMNLAGRMQFEPAFSLEGLSLRVAETALENIYPVYMQPWLISTAYNDLTVGGHAAFELGIGDGVISALSMKLDKVDVIDNNNRFAVRELSTDIQMTEQRRHESRLSWDSIDIYRIGLGAGAIKLTSNDLNIEVTHWQDVPLMDGILRIDKLDIRQIGTPDLELSMAGAIEAVSLPSLTEALDWPILGGALDGEFTGLTYSHGDIRMDGELRVRMFDGEVRIDDLNVRDLFGNLPVLTADMIVQGVDMEQLTSTFAFGKITGRLGGYIRDLELENWQPVAFDARLSTLDDRDTRHRISQKALNNLSQIGGGLRGALSRGFMAYFDEYSYGELGLSCRLANGFCELGGVETYEGGHYLLTRGGLLPPWVEVKLAGSIIAWDALIEGFEQIAEGEVKIE